MRLINSLLQRLIGTACLVLITAAVCHACIREATPDPCGLQEDIAWAIQGGAGAPPHPNWEARLDWTFNRWRNGSSQNWGPLAHAVALWRPPVAGKTLADNVQWWHTFFDCQNGGVPCVVPGVSDVGWLKFMKGTELLSHTYDAPVTTGVASVHYWAKKNNNQALADKARRYLRITFTLYALAAGQGPARSLVVHSPMPNPDPDCNLNDRGTFYFQGPFVAASGMRTNLGNVCTDDRAVLLSRALHLSFTSGREDDSQALLVNLLQSRWTTIANPTVQENVYALDPNTRTLAFDHIQTGNNVDALKSVLAGVRTSVVYRFMAWATADGLVRATMMEQNLNSNTAPVYAEKYTGGSMQQTEILVPNRTFKGGVPLGFASLLPNEFTPNSIQATAEGTTVSMSLPISGKKFHLVLSPTQEVSFR
jgi:hypothetical protein